MQHTNTKPTQPFTLAENTIFGRLKCQPNTTQIDTIKDCLVLLCLGQFVDRGAMPCTYQHHIPRGKQGTLYWPHISNGLTMIGKPDY